MIMNRIFHLLSIGLLVSEQVTAHFSSKPSRILKPSKNGEWIQLEDYLAEFDGDDSGLGYSVASSTDGKVVAYGAPFKHERKGVVGVYKSDATEGWIQMGKDIPGVHSKDEFGFDVALSYNGRILAASSPGSNNMKGYTRIFRYDSSANAWEQIGEHIQGKYSGEESGYSIAISKQGNFVAIGAPGPNTGKATPGICRVYEFDGKFARDEWVQVGYDIAGETNKDNFGHAVDILYDRGEVYLAVGAFMDLESRGSASVFKLNRGTYDWDNLGARRVDGDIKGTELGRSVSLAHDGDTLVLAVGFPGPGVDENSAIKSGAEVYSIDENTGMWDYRGELIYPKQKNDNTGYKVSLSEDGQMLAVSSPAYENGLGLVRVYKYNKNKGDAGLYEQFGADIIGDDIDEMGFSLSLSGNGEVVTAGSPEGMYVTMYLSPGSDMINYYSPGHSAFTVVLMTFFIAGIVVLIGFFILKSTRIVKNKGSIEFTSISGVNNDGAPRIQNAAQFPVQGGSPTAPVPVPDHDSDDDISDGSYEEEDMDYETHLRKIS